MRDAACFARRVPNRLSLSQTDFARHIVLLPHGKKQPLRRGGLTLLPDSPSSLTELPLTIQTRH